MKTTVSARLEAEINEPAEIVLSIVTARRGEESLEITLDGAAVSADVVTTAHGTRLHVVQTPPGKLLVDYRARLAEPATDEIAPVPEADRILYLRPSRYCESDTLAAVAGSEFAGLGGKALLDAVRTWVNRHLAYVSGSSRPTDGAVQTYLSRQGVCRDYAHLVVALLRALEVPARVTSVYAPGLSPMDFHAVAEALVDGQWYVLDATGLAPRPSMVRIATGRDASDTAFLTVHSGRVELTTISITAVCDRLPDDHPTQLVSLG